MVHDGAMMPHGGGSGVPPIRGGVGCVYNGHRGGYGDGGFMVGKPAIISFPWILWRAQTFWICILC